MSQRVYVWGYHRLPSIAAPPPPCNNPTPITPSNPKTCVLVKHCRAYSVPSSSQLPRSNWTERLTAPFKFGAQELVPSAVKLGSAVTLTAVMRRAAGQLGRQLLGHHMRYQVGFKDGVLARVTKGVATL
jgi:hypothetical protein